MGGAYFQYFLVSLMAPLIEQILWLAFALAWGTTHLMNTRSYMDEVEIDTSGENTWGFGQLFPVILLALPMLSIAESYYGMGTPFARLVLEIGHRTQSRGPLPVRPGSIYPMSTTIIS